MDKIDLVKRNKEFAVRVFKMVDLFPRTPAAKVVTYQLLRPSSSFAANYCAVNRVKSGPGFINKIKTVLGEADESNFWLTCISDVEMLPSSDNELKQLIQESNELTAIFTASVKTLNTK